MKTDIQTKLYETGYAKLNMALHVRNRLSNGYHELETIFTFLDKGDLISVSPALDLELTISGPFADGLDAPNNLILKAARLLQKECDVAVGAQLHLNKNLPVASGIGGGSADAAATLRLLNRHWKLDLPPNKLKNLAKSLGADVPACVDSESAFGRGIGQDLQPLEDSYFSAMHVVLANPLIGISTKEIFEKWNGVDSGTLCLDDMSQVLLNGRNDLQPIAMALDNSIAPLLSAIENTNPVAARMSGSGATCFGIFKSAGLAAAAEMKIRSSIKKIWTMTGQLR
ncbi:MAG: 4-(cytidine 5'-diphospho)-2-C-methyl-D-erythritol kinase [Parasphingorhabdus sp.]